MIAPRAALDERLLRELLRDEAFVSRVIVRDSVASTNDVLRDLAAQGAGEGTVLLADEQTDGRGRRGRAWHSPRGLGLFVSVLFRPSESPAVLTRWTLGGALAACEACRQSTGAEVDIKWPNDLVWRGKKLGGVLAETRSADGRARDLVVGTGLNVGQAVADFPGGLSSSATSLRLAAGGTTPDRERLAALYLRELAGIARALNEDDWDGVARRWVARAPHVHGQGVRVVSSADNTIGYEGVTAGIDAVGALRVRRRDGRVASVRAVESVLPMEA